MASKEEKKKKLKEIEEEKRKRNFEKKGKGKKKQKQKLKKQEKRNKKQSKKMLKSLKLKIFKKKIGKGKYKAEGLKQIRGKEVKIEGIIGQGIGRINIKDIHKESESEINKHYERLFEKIVYDKQLRQILAREENIQKVKWRIETRLSLYDMNGKLLGEAIKGSGGSLMDAKSVSKQFLGKGRSVYDGELGTQLKNKGYKFNFTNKGNIERVECNMIFRKGV